VVSYAQNCGNILAGVAPFAIERGLVAAKDPTTDVVVFMENSGQTVTATIETPGGMPNYEGAAELAGVPGGAAPIALAFDDAAGSMCGALLPTGRALDEVQGISVTCIDNGMPIVVLRASDLDRTGYEDRDVLDADGELKARLEAIRLEIGPRMNLGEVEDKSVPKMTLVAPPRAGGIISTRRFIPHRCHASIGVFAALSVASACLFPESPAHALARIPQGRRKRMAVEHPSGSTEVICEVEEAPGGIEIRRGALVRTARKLFAGEVFVPRAIFEGRRAVSSA
jgi:4-oxalomesaconate tautomerase